jgi:hypothetical protein
MEVLRRALESGDVEFIDEDGGGPGVRLRKRQKKKEWGDWQLIGPLALIRESS